MTDSPETIDGYIASQPADVRPILEEVRRRILRVRPDAEQIISYQMPTMRVDGRLLVHFAAWKHHLSLYPCPAIDDPDFEARFAPHRGEKGTAKFPYTEPMPYDLIEETVAVLADQQR